MSSYYTAQVQNINKQIRDKNVKEYVVSITEEKIIVEKGHTHTHTLIYADNKEEGIRTLTKTRN